jgi:hypothetical protein
LEFLSVSFLIFLSFSTEVTFGSTGVPHMRGDEL